MTFSVTTSCKVKTSSSAPSNRSAHRWLPVFTLDELARYTNPIGGFPYAAFQDIANAEFPAYLLDVDRLALVGE